MRLYKTELKDLSIYSVGDILLVFECCTKIENCSLLFDHLFYGCDTYLQRVSERSPAFHDRRIRVINRYQESEEKTKVPSFWKGF